MRNRIPTSFNLLELWLDVSFVTCILCKLEVKQLDHLFLKCEVVARTWNVEFKWLDISQPHFPSIVDLFIWIDQVPISVKKKALVDAVVCTIIWYVWRLRNNKVFAATTIS